MITPEGDLTFPVQYSFLFVRRCISVAPAVFLGLLIACGSAPENLQDEMNLPPSAAVQTPPVERNPSVERRNNSPNDDPRRQVELGSPSSLARAAELIQNLEPSEQTKSGMAALGAAALAILRVVYPDLEVTFPVQEAPANTVYFRILRDAGRGIYTAPLSDSQDFLDHVLPFLAYYSENISAGPDKLRSTLPHLEKAARLNGASVLPSLFRGFALEKTGDHAQAAAAYRRVLELDGGCYPAELGLARILHAQGNFDEEQNLLNGLSGRYPDSISVRKQLARLYAIQQNWQRAGPLIETILARNSRDGEFLLLRARILLDQGLFQQAQQSLDAYAGIDGSNRQYILLRARLQAQGLRNREGAINLLRPLISSDPNDIETALYLASLLMESSRKEEIDEGRLILNRFLGVNATPEALALAAADSVRRENWREAKTYLDRLLSRRRTGADLLNAWKTERALGNAAAALSYARELYNQQSANDEAISAYVSSLIDTGRQAEAARIVDQHLASASGGTQKSLYYYLRSRLRTDEDAVLNDLRSALFEDPRNLEALISMFEIYHRRKDERRAVYYLKQALAIAPDNPQLKHYETEYRSLLGN